jgi:hypothetical protein
MTPWDDRGSISSESQGRELALVSEFLDLPPDHPYDVYLGQHFDPAGLPPQWLHPSYRLSLRHLLEAQSSALWFSKPFWMPSLVWRSEQPWRTLGSDAKQAHQRWAIALLVCERDGAVPDFPWWDHSAAVSAARNSGAGHPGRCLGFLQFDPKVYEDGHIGVASESEGKGGHQRALQRNSLRNHNTGVVEAHIASPTYARRGAWHVVENICGVHYGVAPFRGTSLFFQRGPGNDCALAACLSALLITAQRLKGRPFGFNELIGNAVALLLDHPAIKDLRGGHQRDFGVEVQRFFEQSSRGDSPGPRQRRRCHSFAAALNNARRSLPKPVAKTVRTRLRDYPWWSQFELLSLAIRGVRESGDAEIPKLSKRIEDFRCGALADVVTFGHAGRRGTSRDGDLRRWSDELKQIVGDYLNDGLPVVAAAGLDALGQYFSFIRGKCAQLHLAPLRASHWRGRRHAFLVLGYHWARPCELRPEEFSPRHTIDAFVVSDLCHSHQINIDADDFCRSVIRKANKDVGAPGNVEMDAWFAELLVMVPAGVQLSASEARLRTVQFLEQFRRHQWNHETGLRAALFSSDRALQRYAPIIPKNIRAKETWDRYCRWTREEEQRTGKRLYFWNVEIHRVGPSTDRIPTGPWRPHEPLMVLHWRADKPMRLSEYDPHPKKNGRPRYEGPTHPCLAVDYANRRFWIWPEPGPSADTKKRRVVYPVVLPGGWRPNSSPAHV